MFNSFTATQDTCSYMVTWTDRSIKIPLTLYSYKWELLAIVYVITGTGVARDLLTRGGGGGGHKARGVKQPRRGRRGKGSPPMIGNFCFHFELFFLTQHVKKTKILAY